MRSCPSDEMFQQLSFISQNKNSCILTVYDIAVWNPVSSPATNIKSRTEWFYSDQACFQQLWALFVTE